MVATMTKPMMKEKKMNKLETTMKKSSNNLCCNTINDDPFVDSLMKRQAQNFYTERDETGELVYHWIDTRVDMLSSSKLWSILRLCEEADNYMDLAFTNAITNELINRNDFETRPMMRIQ